MGPSQLQGYTPTLTNRETGLQSIITSYVRKAYDSFNNILYTLDRSPLGFNAIDFNMSRLWVIPAMPIASVWQIV